jgi:hypothetical protein
MAATVFSSALQDFDTLRLSDVHHRDEARLLDHIRPQGIAKWSDDIRLPRFSIANGLALIAILAVALAALRTPSYLWANVTYSLALGAIIVAIVNDVPNV